MAIKFKGVKLEPVQPTGESAALIAQIRKDKGDKAIIKGSEVPSVECIPTGIFEMDLALGGGFPKSRLCIVYGPEGSGKSTVCYGWT
jgi:recombination protein RecA